MKPSPVVVSRPSANTIEQVLIKGDLAALTPEQRLIYYKQVCESVGLNPLTKPFEYITLNGRLVLYALKAATEQLRSIRKVSITKLDKELIGEVYTVTAHAKDADCREDSATGAVCLTGLKGENLANAYMKAETKAKRRVTLSICGLGLLDESEVEDMPASAKGNGPGAIIPQQPGPDDGSTSPTGYTIDFGQWNQRTIEEVYRMVGPKKIADYIVYQEGEAAKQNRAPTPKVARFIREAEAYLGAMENASVAEEAAL